MIIPSNIQLLMRLSAIHILHFFFAPAPYYHQCVNIAQTYLHPFSSSGDLPHWQRFITPRIISSVALISKVDIHPIDILFKTYGYRAIHILHHQSRERESVIGWRWWKKLTLLTIFQYIIPNIIPTQFGFS